MGKFHVGKEVLRWVGKFHVELGKLYSQMTDVNLFGGGLYLRSMYLFHIDKSDGAPCAQTKPGSQTGTSTTGARRELPGEKR